VSGDGPAGEVEAPRTPCARVPKVQSFVSCRPDDNDPPGDGEVVEQPDSGQSATASDICSSASDDTGYDGDFEESSNSEDTL